MSTELRISFPASLIQALGQYLLTRPMGEVRGLVEALEREGQQADAVNTGGNNHGAD